MNVAIAPSAHEQVAAQDLADRHERRPDARPRQRHRHAAVRADALAEHRRQQVQQGGHDHQ